MKMQKLKMLLSRCMDPFNQVGVVQLELALKIPLQD